MIQFRAVLAALVAWLALTAMPVMGQAYPNRPIRLILPYGPGGVSDITARTIGPRLSEILGQPVVIENRPGGASIPATDMVAKAAPDGYTIVLATTAMAANNYLFKTLPYDVQKDFAPVTLVGVVPTVLVVHPDMPAKTVGELIALAKAKPGEINYGSAGNGSGNHLTTEAFKHAAGVDIMHIPYKGGGAVMTDLMAGRVSMVFAVLPTAYPYITSGKLRALAVSSSKRSPALPDVPTVSEAGVPGFDVTEWIGIFAPAGTPPEIITTLRNGFVKALESPDVADRLKKLGEAPVGSTPQELAAHLKSELDRWGRLAKVTKLEVAN